MDQSKIQPNGSFAQIKQQMISYLSAYSSRKSSDREQSINFDRLQLFMDQKQQEIKDLQNFLVGEFESIERFKDIRGKVMKILGDTLVQLFKEIKDGMKFIIQENKNVMRRINHEWGGELFRIVKSKDVEIATLQNKLKEERKVSQKLKEQIQNNRYKSSIEMEIFKDLEEQKIKRKHQQLGNREQKVDIKFERIPYRPINKGEAESILSTSRAQKYLKKSNNLSKSATILLAQHQNPCIQQMQHRNMELHHSDMHLKDKIHQVHPFQRTVLVEVNKHQNDKQKQPDHKKYIKQKIQLLKSKGSRVREFRPEKVEKWRAYDYEGRKF